MLAPLFFCVACLGFSLFVVLACSWWGWYGVAVLCLGGFSLRGLLGLFVARKLGMAVPVCCLADAGWVVVARAGSLSRVSSLWVV